jgi:hypothetical protein
MTSNKKANLPALVTPAKNFNEYTNAEVCLLNSAATNSAIGKKILSHINEKTGDATFIIDNGTLTIKEYGKDVKEFNTNTAKLLDYLIMQLTKQNPYREGTEETINKEIKIKIKDYQNYRGLKDYKTLKQQLKQDIATLYQTSIKWQGKTYNGKNKPVHTTLETRLIYERKELKNGIITVKFTPEIANNLIYSHLFRLPKKYWSLKKHAAEILRAISKFKRIRLKTNSNYIIIGTQPFLKHINSIISYEELMKSSDRHTGERIIKPLENGLNELEKEDLIKGWNYCNFKGERLTEKQLYGTKSNVGEELEWNTFKDLYLQIFLKPSNEIPAKNP